jgi:glycosyltransferase involved in cell wall biosynthesis
MVIIHIVEPFAAGIAVFVKSLTETMPEDTHIVVHGERKEEMTAEEVKKKFPRQNVKFIRWYNAQRSINPVRDFIALTELYRKLRKLKAKNMADAVHLHSSKSGLLGRIACRMAGIKNVFYTPNGASFLAAHNRITQYFYKLIEKAGNLIGGNVVCCSVSELNEYMKLGINASYVNNGITIHQPASISSKPASKKFKVVTSGRIEKQKNPALFNRIASYFQDMDQIEFVWIGDGRYKGSFTSRNIKVTGWLDNKDVHEYVSSSQIYLSTSRYEGLSFAVLEALSLKKPVLLSNCTGNTDIVKKGINGDLFDTSSEAIVKILQYYNNREMLDVMGSFSAEICKTEFDVKENYKAYRELYAGSLAGSRKRAIWSFG